MSNAVPHEPIRVFLLIENRLQREALVRLLRKPFDVIVVGQTGQRDLTIRDVLDSNCDVLVITPLQGDWPHVNLPLESIGQLCFKVVLIGMDADEKQFMTAVRAGVTGYLLQDAAAVDVVSAIRAVFRDEAVCPSQLCATLFRFVAQAATATPIETAGRPEITLRQQQLFALVAKGFTNKQIASQLNLSEYTVRNHIHRILKQVHAASRKALEVMRTGGFVLNA